MAHLELVKFLPSSVKIPANQYGLRLSSPRTPHPKSPKYPNKTRRAISKFLVEILTELLTPAGLFLMSPLLKHLFHRALNFVSKLRASEISHSKSLIPCSFVPRSQNVLHTGLGCVGSDIGLHRNTGYRFLGAWLCACRELSSAFLDVSY